MNRLRVLFLLPLLAIYWSPTATLADDVAAERARLASQRIQAEDERRVREEKERLEQVQRQGAAGDPVQSMESAVERVNSTEPPVRAAEDAGARAAADRIEMSRALEQLRELGSLRDAGYVTEEEFALLKKKILDGAL